MIIKKCSFIVLILIKRNELLIIFAILLKYINKVTHKTVKHLIKCDNSIINVNEGLLKRRMKMTIIINQSNGLRWKGMFNYNKLITYKIDLSIITILIFRI